jgi:hypothetical protein
MGDSRRAVVVLLGAVLCLVPVSGAQTSIAEGPVENGNFEGPYVPAQVYEPAEGSAADECIGVGHQVLYGPQSPAGYATGGKAGDPNPDDAAPQKAAENATESPAYWADFQSGYGHCVFEPNGRGEDVAWLNPVDTMKNPAMWSVHPFFPSTVFGFGFDDDPFDREAKFPAKSSGQLANHNLWQSYVSQPGVYTANFDELAFDVEQGEVPNSAGVVVSLSATPLDTQSPWVAGYYDCQLSFGTDVLEADATGRVAVDPLDAGLSVDQSDSVNYCENAQETLEDPDASEEEKRDALGRLRIVQISFWGFNVDHGETPVVVDDIGMPGASTAVEEAAEGNVNPNPTVRPDDV